MYLEEVNVPVMEIGLRRRFSVNQNLHFAHDIFDPVDNDG